MFDFWPVSLGVLALNTSRFSLFCFAFQSVLFCVSVCFVLRSSLFRNTLFDTRDISPNCTTKIQNNFHICKLLGKKFYLKL